MTRQFHLSLQRPARPASGAAARTHAHWFRWHGEDPFGNGSLYRCRCGVVRSGL
ncbi:hypothetical protein [Blastococcus saxobsidens]|uniref:Uncharacterized protein n=1 Tax=Blastococcus saxobsidens TaxID=138336 RepID=A0A4Q7YC86_9ACTN|nr:hypothetical protein [Blastococcus saxobsidens]RZU34113.1 hypothetical protein BKA19_3868 [Blastococcus saxobsidens]